MTNLLVQHADAVFYGVGLVVILLIYMPFSPMLIDILMLPRGVQLGIYRYRHVLWAIVTLCWVIVLVRALGGVGEPTGWSASIVGALKGVTVGWGPALVGTGDPVWLKTVVITALVAIFMFWSGYVPYVMTPPRRPAILDVAEAAKVIDDDEIVLGVVENGEAHAYLRNAISRPHFFRDSVGGTPFTVSYCILCNSAMAFKSELNGKPMNLKCVTAYNNNIIYHDPETRNYIQQLDGAVFHGPDKGAVLKSHPVVQATWGEWKKLYPGTKYYHAPSATLRDKMVDGMLQMLIPINKLSKRKKPWHRIRGKLDTRLPAMSYVYALEVGDECKGYPESLLRETPVINDSVGGQPIVVMYNAGHDVGGIFARELDGRLLTFTAIPGPGEAVARDNETGTLWDVTGRAIEGALAGTTLQGVPHYNKLFWFSWPLFKPGTKLKLAA